MILQLTLFGNIFSDYLIGVQLALLTHDFLSAEPDLQGCAVLSLAFYFDGIDQTLLARSPQQLGPFARILNQSHSQGLHPTIPLLRHSRAFSPWPRSLREICRRGRSGKFRSLDFLPGRGSLLLNASSGFGLGRVPRAMLFLAAPDERLREDDQCAPFQYNRRRLL